MANGRVLVLGGVFLIILAMIFGTIFAALLHGETEQQGSESARSTLGLTADGGTGAGGDGAGLRGETRGRIRTSHSHLALFGVIAALFGLGLYADLVHLGETWLTVFTWVYLSGAVLLPAGVFVQALGASTPGFIISAVGGLSVLAGTAGFLGGFWLGTRVAGR